MKKTNTIIIAAALVCAAAVTVLVMFLTGDGGKIPVAGGSTISANDKFIFYNDTRGRVCRTSDGKSAKVIAREGGVLSASTDAVLVNMRDGLAVLGNGGNEKEKYTVSASFGAVTPKYIYYAEGGKIMRITRGSGEVKEMGEASGEITQMAYSEGKLVYLCGKTLCVLDEETLENKILLNAEIAWITAGEDFVALPNHNNGYSVVKTSLDGMRASEMKNLKSKTFAIKDDIVYYIDNAYFTDEKEYELLSMPYKVG